ncbi:hypothetical protein B0H17DRAFT_236322 [Mycena rosella]|uniref:F-box domain-containing protein n=1 Tax=Mycena rosella TaxID=1033263 RepID=A0AAD7MBV0_MYCRO|nr:hypothetical protein B0H17DRAFT_236322 [Mycena rosella]
MTLIRFFPAELLAVILAAPALDASDVATASHVSRWWRDAAVGASELWLNVRIKDRATNHADVVLEHFRRSQQRPICLEIQFTSKTPPFTPSQLRAFLEVTVKPNLGRCRSLTMRATPPSWDAFSATCGEEPYPLLRTLEVTTVHIVTKLTLQSEEPRFALPQNHPLEQLSLHAMSVGDVQLPCMHMLRVGGQLRGLVGADGQINRRLLDGPRRLEICSLAIPPMHFQTQDEDDTEVSSVEHLKLSWMYASINGHGGQNDCAPFFDALQTPLIRTLQLESFHGRVWEDFLFSLNVPTPKYPLLTTLQLTTFDFQQLSYEGIGFFFCCFPGLEAIVFVRCPLSTWESAVHVLMLHPALCPSLSAVEVNGVLLNREEPLPFATVILLAEDASTRRR